MKSIRFVPAILIIVVLAGCHLPKSEATPQPEAIFTLAVQTVDAELTRVAQTQTLPTLAVSPTLLASSTATIVLTTAQTATPTPIPCNAAGFAGDVTIPDGTAMAPNQTFIKTWRLKNIGTCTWNSAYQLVFDHDNAMSGPASQPLTTGTVAPGGALDISINLKAPPTAGAYKGFWRLRDPNGVLFGLGGGEPFWVAIKVDPTLPLMLTLDFVAAESGSVRSNGDIKNEIHVGDTTDNFGSQVFLSFDISAIPKTATIVEGAMDLLQGCTIVGGPFSALGCLDVYQQDYIPLDASDFFGGAPSDAFIVVCDQASLDTIAVDNDFKVALQAKLGSTRIQFRLQFPDKLSNGGGVADQVRLGMPKLIIKYTMP
jgi:hypothetical protein